MIERKPQVPADTVALQYLFLVSGVKFNCEVGVGKMIQSRTGGIKKKQV